MNSDSRMQENYVGTETVEVRLNAYVPLIGQLLVKKTDYPFLAFRGRRGKFVQTVQGWINDPCHIGLHFVFKFARG